MYARTQSNERPARVEKYSDLWRVNWNVTESTREDGSSDFEYDMAEIPANKYGYADFIAAVITARYDIDTQIAILANDSQTEESAAKFAEFQTFRQSVKAMAKDICGVERTLEDAKAEKVAELTAFDSLESPEGVNWFYINGTGMWLKESTRTGLRLSIESNAAQGKETIGIIAAGITMDVPLTLATQLILALQDYAYRCYNVTASHKAAISALDTVGAVDAYDFRTGYPAHPRFMTNNQ